MPIQKEFTSIVVSSFFCPIRQSTIYKLIKNHEENYFLQKNEIVWCFSIKLFIRMSNKQLIELLKYCSPHIIYVVNSQNRIIKLHTPFKLKVMEDVGGLYKNQLVFCTELKITKEGRIVFFIDGKNYHTNHFDILAK